ncbi:unnamed protein product [Gongylonema pulchrum]|uniref:WAP domain-containing protein n=1 Tax=Gongylonema pulchrum TaxID=637853 RepID=A0A183DZD7_9BILA|nr:unnamed protein product [Gongylonema pulchrum]
MCALYKESYQEDGKVVICWGQGKHYAKCPSGYRCKHFEFSGICCPKESEDYFLNKLISSKLQNYMKKNTNSSCAKGHLMTHEFSGRQMPLLGKSCLDDFCPADSKCHEQKVFAYCCQRLAFEIVCTRHC